MPYAGETVQTLVGLRPSGEAVVFPLADHRSNRRYDTSAVVGAAAELAAHSLAGGQPTLGDKARLVAACRALPEPDDPTFARWWVLLACPMGAGQPGMFPALPSLQGSGAL